MPTTCRKLKQFDATKWRHALVYDDVVNLISELLRPLNLEYSFDVNQGAVFHLQHRTLMARDNCSNRTEVQVNPRKAIIIAPFAAAVRHWSLMVKIHNQVLLYHSQRQLYRKYHKVSRDVASTIFDIEVVVRDLHNDVHQHDDMSCGAFVVLAAYQIVTAYSRGSHIKLNFNYNDVAWLLASRDSETARGRCRTPRVQVHYIQQPTRRVFSCPFCDKKTSQGWMLDSHMSMKHGCLNGESLQLHQSILHKRASLDGVRGLAQRLEIANQYFSFVIKLE